jgi:hypothetical protein
MHANCLTQVAVVVLAIAALADASAQSARSAPAVEGPWIGVWRLNADKTAAANGRPRPAAAATGTIFRMVVVRGDVFKYTMETVPVDGAAPVVRAELIGRFDGQDYIEIGNPAADTNRFRIIDRPAHDSGHHFTGWTNAHVGGSGQEPSRRRGAHDLCLRSRAMKNWDPSSLSCTALYRGSIPFFL